jgi:hypothetical protein
MFNAYGVRGRLLILINAKREVHEAYYTLKASQHSSFIPLKSERRKQFQAYLLHFHAFLVTQLGQP